MEDSTNRENLKSNKRRLKRQVESQGKMKTLNKNNYAVNYRKSKQTAVKDQSIMNQTTKELKVAWFKKELTILRREKDKILEDFNSLTQKYER